jgi:ribosomal protein L12E/L44/L45/RPP1/RPP2
VLVTKKPNGGFMKIASVLMTVAFAGVVAHANETAPAAPAQQAAPAAAATTTEVKTEKKMVKKTHAKKEDKSAQPAAH